MSLIVPRKFSTTKYFAVENFLGTIKLIFANWFKGKFLIFKKSEQVKTSLVCTAYLKIIKSGQEILKK